MNEYYSIGGTEWYGDGLLNGDPGPMLPHFAVMTDNIILAMQEALLGVKTPKEALDDAANSLEATLEGAGYYD